LSGRITVSSPVSLTLSFLQEHLFAFQLAHPALELDVRLIGKPTHPCALAQHACLSYEPRTPARADSRLGAVSQGATARMVGQLRCTCCPGDNTALASGGYLATSP
jgi:DNA-binding transcriptional LysR family regulator